MAEIAQLITSIATLIGVGGSIYLSWRNSVKIQAVHEATNGKMDTLIKVVGEAEFAKGVLQQKENDHQ